MKINPDSNIDLLSGMPGAGKSETRKILAVRGHRTINLDTYRRAKDDLRLCFWGNDDGVPAVMPEDQSRRAKLWGDTGWLRENYWRWRPEVMMDIILGHDQSVPLVLDGRARNQEDFFPYFGTVALLSINQETMLKRLDDRKDDPDHAFGQDPVTQGFLIASLPDFEMRALVAGAIRLDVNHLGRTQVANAVQEIFRL